MDPIAVITAISGAVIGIGGLIATLVQSRRTARSERENAVRATAQQLLDEGADYRQELRGELTEVKRQLTETNSRLIEVQRENLNLLTELSQLRVALEKTVAGL